MPRSRVFPASTWISFASELDALKLLFLIAARRDRQKNVAMMTYETIESYSGVTREQIRRGLTVLAVVGVVHVDRVRSNAGVDRIASAYRLAHVDPYRHMGTIGRAEIPTPGPAESSPTGFALIPRR